jgi:hypothetical protein
MVKIEKGTSILFLVTVVAYFWLVLLLDFGIFTNVMGHFNFVPPKVCMEKYFTARWNLQPHKTANTYIREGGVLKSVRLFSDSSYNSPFLGSIMNELEFLCKNAKPKSIGLLWRDYKIIIRLAGYECPTVLMEFERLYTKYKNPVRTMSEKNRLLNLNSYIRPLDTNSKKEVGFLAVSTKHLGLFKTQEK